MHRSPSPLALACALAACLATTSSLTACSSGPGADAPASAPPAQPVASDRDGRSEATAAPVATRLTIYSGGYGQLADSSGQPGPAMPGYALVARPLHYSLGAGRNTVSATSVPPTMDVEAAVLRPRNDKITVESQRFVAPLSGSNDVLSRMIGQRVTVEHTAGGAKQTDTGILLASDNGLTLALGDDRIKVIREYDSFSVVNGVELLPQQALLRWTVNAPAAMDAAFVLSYPMGGLAWRAEYVATLADGDDCRLSLDGAALIANRSGVSFADAKLTLVAGEPNRVQDDDRRQRMAYSRAADVAAAPAEPVERRSAEYHAYELPGTTRIRTGATERVPLFFPRRQVQCRRSYVVDAGTSDWRPPRPLVAPDRHGRTGELPVTATVSLRNSKQAGLGQPLPAGRVRVFDGRDFLGESRLPHTATGEEVRLQLGTAFDLGAEREATSFSLDRGRNTLTESFAITLNNAKAQDATVRVIEPLPRWGDWEIVDSSVPAEKKDANHVEFDVPVPAGGETRLTYTVRYRWAQDVNP